MSDLTDLKNSINDFEQRVYIKFGVLKGQSAGLVHSELQKLLDTRAYKKGQLSHGSPGLGEEKHLQRSIEEAIRDLEKRK